MKQRKLNAVFVPLADEEEEESVRPEGRGRLALE